MPIAWLSTGFEVALMSHSCGFGWPCPAFRGSKCELGSSKFGFHYKDSEYNSPIPPPSGWSGGTLAPPWYLPIPIELSQSPIFDQASLSKARKPLPEPAAKRRKRRKRDVEVGSPVAQRPPHRSRRAICPHRAPQANTRCIARRKVGQCGSVIRTAYGCLCVLR